MSAFPEILLAVMGLVGLLLGVFHTGLNTRMMSRLVVLAFALSGLFLFQGSGTHVVLFQGLFVMDSWAFLLKLLVLMAASAMLLLSTRYLEKESIARFEYPILILFAVLGMMVMISANDFLSLYIGLELQSLSLYILTAFHRDSARSSEAGLKYFILGALSSGLLLYGISFIYGFAGSTNFEQLALLLQHQEISLGLSIGLVFILAGFAFKLGVVPFHMWVPDVYEGTITPVTGLLSTVPKLAGIAVLIRLLMGPFESFSGQWQQIIVLISVASMVVGAFGALPQTNIKRLMAYSTIGHMGYALLGLIAAGHLGAEAIQSILLYIITYSVAGIGVFAIILSMCKSGVRTEEIEDFAGLSKTNPVLALVMTILLFSMAGFPPLAGFFGKFYVFMAAIKAGFYPLAIVGVITSVVAAVYYLRLIKLMYFEDSKDDGFDKRIGRESVIILTCTAGFSVLFLLFADPILSHIGNAVAVL